MALPIGIDLGTTFTVVATLEEGRPKVIPNAEGEDLTPSVVAFDRRGNPTVGRDAKMHAPANPERTIHSIKRHMGSGYRVRINDGWYTPPEISSLVLGKVKADAESYLGQRIDQAVITVPAYFDDLKRQATRQAGLLAGLEVPRIINEPTASALAYGMDREEVRTIMVWDLGGGTFDVSILRLGEGIFEVLAVSGDTWLGGDDIDRRLMEFLATEYQKASGLTFPESGAAWQALRMVAENAKIQLSYQDQVPVRLLVNELDPCGHLDTVVTQAELELIAGDLIQRTIGPAEQALSDAGLAPADIDRVLLVGGATRMPAVRRLVREFMGQEPYRYLDPDKVVALGAAIQSGMLLGLIDRAVLLDVLPLSLGVETQGGLTARIIHRNTPLPVSEGHVFTTASDGQTSVDVHVLQGERQLARDNISLGRFSLDGIPSGRRGSARVEVSFDVDVDGMVKVSAKELRSEAETTVQIASSKRLDVKEVQRHAAEAQRNAEIDRLAREAIEVRIEAENTIAAAALFLQEMEGRLTDLEAQRVHQLTSELRNGLAGGTADSLRAYIGEVGRLLQALKAGRAQPAGSPDRGSRRLS